MNDDPLSYSVDEVTYATLAKAITHDVGEALAEISSRKRNFLIGFTAVVATTFTALVGIGVPLYISDQVAKQFSAFRIEELHELYLMRDLANLELLMNQVDPAAPAVLAQLSRVQEHVRHIESTYLKGSEQGLRRARDLSAQIADRRDVLFNQFARIPESGRIALFVNAMAEISEFEVPDVQVGVQALGREIIGARNGAVEWQIGDGDVAALFPAYLTATVRARQSIYPELALLFELIRLHMEASDHGDIPILLKELENLRAADKLAYVDLMSDFLTQEWHPRPDSWSSRIAERAAALIHDNPDSPVLAKALAEAIDGGYVTENSQ